MATKDTNYLVAVHKGLDESLEKQVAALPEKFNKQRFLQNCMTVLQDGQADFSKCEAPTVVRTLLKGAFLLQEIYLIRELRLLKFHLWLWMRNWQSSKATSSRFNA